MSTGIQTSRPTPNKSSTSRRPPCHPPTLSRKTPDRSAEPAAGWYIIKDIVAEKYRRGKLLYKVDWDGLDPATNRPYEQSWIAAEDVTGDAVESWVRSKRSKRQAGEGSSLDSDPVQSPNWRARRRVYGGSSKDKRRLSEDDEEEAGNRTSKRLKRGEPSVLSSECEDSQDQEEYSQPQPPPPPWLQTAGPPDFSIEIQTRPGFDPSEYTRFTSSQLPSNDESSAAVLPPSQVTDSQPHNNRAKGSQTTIPDSQGFSVPVLPAHTRPDDILPSTPSEQQSSAQPPDPSLISSSSASAALAWQGPTRPPPSSIITSQKESLDIPSHQPGSLARTSGSCSQSSRGLQTRHLESCVNGQECSDGNSGKSGSVALRETLSQSGTLDFLTQPDFRFGYSSVDSSPSRSPQKALVSGSRTGISSIQGSSAGQQTSRVTDTGSRSVVVSGELLHSAQIVHPLSAVPSEPDHRVRNRLGSTTNGGEHEVIPQTSEYGSARRQTFPFSVQAADKGYPGDPESAVSASRQAELGDQTDCLSLQSSARDSQRRAISSPRDDGVEEGGANSLPGETGRQRSDSSHTCGAATPPNAVKSPDRNSRDGSLANSDTMSALDELRQLQAEVFGEPAITDINPALEELTQAQERALDQEMVSPSAILSSIEGDGVTASPQMPGDAAAAGSATWPPEPLAALDESINPSVPSVATQEAGGSLGSQRFSAVEELRRGLGLGIEFPPHMSSTNEEMHAAQDSHVAPSATIEPSALVTSTDFLAIPTTSLPMVEAEAEVVGGVLAEDDAAEVESPSVDTYDLPPNDVNDALEDLVIPLAAAANEYIVTLPLAANARQLYANLIKENRPMILEFSSAFNEVASVPSEGARAGVDLMFEKLLDLCDLPAYADSIPDMPEEEMMRHATNSNSKFSFLFELLEDIRNVDARILVLSKPGRVADYVKAVVAATGLEFRRLNDGIQQAAQDPVSTLSILIADTSMSMSDLPDDADVVIGFDQEARSSSLFRHYLSPNDYTGLPIVLSLVAAQTLEHLDLRYSRTMDAMERKNALVISGVHSISYLLEPGRGYPEPDEVALIFGSQIKEPRDDFLWDPQPIPDDIFDVYLSSQAQLRSTQESTAQHEVDAVKPNGRKRHLDDGDDGEGTPKRARFEESTDRLVPLHQTRLSETLLGVLGGAISTKGSTVEVSLDQLESLAAKMAHAESQLKEREGMEDKLHQLVRNLEAQVKLHEKTIRKIQPKYMEALRDRGTFEVECASAVKAAESAKGQLESSKAAAAKLKEEKLALEQKLAEAHASLAGSDKPDLVRLARLEEEARAAQAKVEGLEKKVASHQTDLDYARDAYQTASNSAVDLSSENKELRARIKELELKASENLVLVHRTNRTAEVDEYRSLWLEQQAIARDRERELDRSKDEVRVLRNGRRETRQQSVPRSPRMGVMSPRPPRGGQGAGAGFGSGGGGGGGGGGGPSSRGTSPAPAAYESAPIPPLPTFFGQPPGNGRWGHLRD